MSKFAEKLTILLGASEGIFTRLHRIVQMFGNPKTCPAFLQNKAFEKVSAAFEKAFPKLPPDPTKIGGYNETVQNAASSLIEVLGQHYYTFVDFQEWNLAARETLLEIGQGTTTLKYDANTTLTEGFLDLLQTYIRLLFVMQQIGARTLILSTFARAYFHAKMANEPSFDRTAEFVACYNEIMPKLQLDFRPIGNQIADAIMSLQLPMLAAMDVTSLRTKGVHSLTLKPDLMALPSDDQQLYDIMHLDRMHLRVLYGLLACPEAYNRINTDFVGSLLQESLVVPVYRGLSMDLLNRYNVLVKNFKPKRGDIPPELAKELTKSFASLKKSLQDAEKSIERGDFLQVHERRRIYLRLECSVLLHLFSDKPGLLAPKISLLLSLLAFAREELLWLVRHNISPIPKGLKLKAEDFTDRHVTDLVYLIHKLTQLVREHEALIRDYYLQFLSVADFRAAQKEVSALQLPPGAKAQQLVTGILAEMKSLRPGAAVNCAGLRLNLFRFESWLSSTESSQFVDPLKVLLQKLTVVSRHSVLVDALSDLLDEYVVLDDLFYLREGFKQAFLSATVGGSTQPQRAMVFVRLLAEFAGRPSPFCPDEHIQRGKACVILGRMFLDRIALCINNGLMTIAHQMWPFEAQLSEENAAHPVLQASPGWKPPKDFVPPITPGQESTFEERVAHGGLAGTESTVFQLCSALNEDVSIQIHDTVFIPREFLREKLAQTIKDFLGNKVVGEPLERPALLERRVQNFLSVIILVENYLDMNLTSVFRDTWLSQVFQPSVQELGTFGANVPQLSEWEGNMVRPIVQFYVNFVTTHLMGADRTAVVWSKMRQAFVSRTGLAFRAEEYASFTEVRAVCRLIGPYGVKLLDAELLKLAASVTRKLREMLQENRAACSDLQKAFQDSNVDVLGVLKKFSNLDNVVNMMVNLGLILHFRGLVHDALGFVMRDQSPFLYSAVDEAFLQYPTNTFLEQDFVACDLLAAECGVDVGTADQSIKLALKDAMGTLPDDAQLWSLLPTLTAACFISKSWLEADYRTALEGYRNNLHCITKSLSWLMLCSRAHSTQNRTMAALRPLLENFVVQGSWLLMRVSQLDPASLKKLVPTQTTNWADAIIFLDLFVQEAPSLQREAIEKVMPYALIRTMYNQVYQGGKEEPGKTGIRGKQQRKEAVDAI